MPASSDNPGPETDYRREYRDRLPIPLADLYFWVYKYRAAPQTAHNYAYYLLEALVKLLTVPLAACYLRELRQSGARAAAVDEQLVRLSKPMFGEWLGMLRELAQHFGTRVDAGAHPLGNIWQQLTAPRNVAEMPHVVALYRRIKNGVDKLPAGDQACTLRTLFDSLGQYRNDVIGHGAQRPESFYQELWPLLFHAANEILAPGALDLLGPPGSHLVHLGPFNTSQGTGEPVTLAPLTLLEGTGEMTPLDPLRLRPEEAAALRPQSVAVLWPGEKLPLLVDPLVMLRDDDVEQPDLVLLNRDRDRKRTEYLSYLAGNPITFTSRTKELAALFSLLTGEAVSDAELERLTREEEAEQAKAAESAQHGPQVIDDYELLAELGRGGMGIVYLARQRSLDRLVALKMLPAHVQADPVALARFLREQRTLSRCDHPHIVKLLFSGVLSDGRRYYTMEYVPGADLDKVWWEVASAGGTAGSASLSGTTWSRAVLSAAARQRADMSGVSRTGSDSGGKAALPQPAPAVPHASALHELPEAVQKLLPPLPELPWAAEDPGGYFRRVASLMRDAALALQAVHDRNIVHRDVTPANLMLTPDGQRIVLMDFGLAKLQAVSRGVTQGGKAPGTSRYMAPEQLAEQNLRVRATADVRALGVVMWELLARRRLFADAENDNQLRQWVFTKEVPLLRNVDPTIDRDLEAIVSRATMHDQEERIGSARQLAEYLQMYLDGLALPIRPPGVWEFLVRRMKQHQGAAVGGVAIVALLVIAVTSFLLVNKANNDLIVARDKERIAQEESERQIRQTAAMWLTYGSWTGREKSPQRSLLLAAEAADRNPHRGNTLPPVVEQNLIDVLDELGGETLGVGGPVSVMQLSSSEKWLLTAGHDSAARLWDLSGGLAAAKPRVFGGHKERERVVSAAISADEKWLVTGSDDKTVQLWDLTKADDQPRVLQKHEKPLLAVAFSPNSRWLVSSDSEGRVVRWNLLAADRAAEPHELLKIKDYVHLLAFSPDGARLASGGFDGIVRVWNLDRDGPTDAPRELQGHPGILSSLAFSPDSRQLCSLDATRIGLIWNLAAEDPGADPLVINPDQVDVKTLTNNQRRPIMFLSLDGRDKLLGAAEFAPEGDLLVTSSFSRTPYAWAPGQKARVNALQGHLGGITALRFSPNGEWLATASLDRTVRVWPTASFRGTPQSRELRGAEGAVTTVAFDRKSERLFWASEDGMVRQRLLKSLDQGAEELVVHHAEEHVTQAAFVGDCLLSVASDKLGSSDVVRLWDARGRPPKQLEDKVLETPGYTLWVGGEGRFLARRIENDRGQLLRFDATRRTYDAFSLTGDKERLAFVTAAPGDKLLATIDRQDVVRLWDLDQWPPQATTVRLQEDEADTFVTAASPAGQWLVTVSRDQQPVFRRLVAGKQVDTMIIPPPTSLFDTFTVSDNGRWLVTGGSERVALLWRIENDRLPARPIELIGFTGNVTEGRFTKDGRWVILADGAGPIRMWRLDRPNIPATGAKLADHPETVNLLQVSPSGRWLASAGFDGSVRLWDLEAEHPEVAAIVLSAHREMIWDIAFDATGERLATAAGDGTLKVWDLSVERLAARARAVAGRKLTPEERRRYLLPVQNGKD